MTDSMTLDPPVETPIDRTQRLTFDEYIRAYDGVHAEYVDGEVFVMSPASATHQLVKKLLLQVMDAYVQQHQLGLVLDAPFAMRTEVRPTGREPDILFIAAEHLGRLLPNAVDGPADLVVEIISPESDERDRGVKFVEYEAAGVREYWLIDPIRRQADFYRRDDDGLYRRGPLEDGVYRSLVIPGLWIREGWLWQTPLPKALDCIRELGLI